jgi:hypothetical protein
MGKMNDLKQQKTYNSFQGITEELSNMLRIKSGNHASSNNILMMVNMEGPQLEAVDFSMIVEATLQDAQKKCYMLSCCNWIVTGRGLKPY